MIKRLSSFLVIFLIAIINITACSNTDRVNQKTSHSETVYQNIKEKNSQELKIHIDSYKSDKMKQMGYDVRIQRKRFPVPTTLNELGKEWSFNSGDIKDRESGAYDGQRYWRVGNFYTSEWYEAGTKKKIYDTSVELCYKNVPILAVGIDDFRKDGQYSRNTKIDGIFDGDLEREHGLLGFTINGIRKGDVLDKSIKNIIGDGHWEQDKYNIIFEKKKKGISVSFGSPIKTAKGKGENKKYIIKNINIGTYKRRSKTPMGFE